MNNNKLDEQDRYKQGQRIIWITIILNIILAIGKIGIGIFSKSNAILADGIHTASDVASSIGIIVGLFIAKKPEDTRHQYGHEKAESIVTLILSLVLIFTGLKIGYSSIVMVFTKTAVIPGLPAAWAAAISVIVKEIQFRLTLNVGKKIRSDAFIADAWHHRTDALSSIAVLIGIIGSRLGYKLLDPLAGFIVSLIVIKVGIEIFIKVFDELMDVSISEEKLNLILENIIQHEEVIAVNDIKARKHGSKVFVDISIAVKHDITVKKGHDISEDVENTIYKCIDNVKDVMVHVNPCTNDKDQNCRTCKKNINKILNEIDKK